MDHWVKLSLATAAVNTLRSRKDGRDFAGDILKCVCLKVCSHGSKWQYSSVVIWTHGNTLSSKCWRILTDAVISSLSILKTPNAQKFNIRGYEWNYISGSHDECFVLYCISDHHEKEFTRKKYLLQFIRFREEGDFCYLVIIRHDKTIVGFLVINSALFRFIITYNVIIIAYHVLIISYHAIIISYRAIIFTRSRWYRINQWRIYASVVRSTS